jgi:uncharacterized membrane protein
LIAVVVSLIFPDKEFKWSMLNERIPLVDDIEPPKEDGEEDARLKKHVTVAIVASVTLTFILLILWPLPMHWGAGVFSEGGFTVWVVLEILWAVVAGVVIIILPAVEIIMTFMKAKKDMAAGDAKASLTDGTTLVIQSKVGASSENNQCVGA